MSVKSVSYRCKYIAEWISFLSSKPTSFNASYKPPHEFTIYKRIGLLLVPLLWFIMFWTLDSELCSQETLINTEEVLDSVCIDSRMIISNDGATLDTGSLNAHKMKALLKGVRMRKYLDASNTAYFSPGPVYNQTTYSCVNVTTDADLLFNTVNTGERFVETASCPVNFIDVHTYDCPIDHLNIGEKKNTSNWYDNIPPFLRCADPWEDTFQYESQTILKSLNCDYSYRGFGSGSLAYVECSKDGEIMFFAEEIRPEKVFYKCFAHSGDVAFEDFGGTLMITIPNAYPTDGRPTYGCKSPYLFNVDAFFLSLDGLLRKIALNTVPIECTTCKYIPVWTRFQITLGSSMVFLNITTAISVYLFFLLNG